MRTLCKANKRAKKTDQQQYIKPGDKTTTTTVRATIARNHARTARRHKTPLHILHNNIDNQLIRANANATSGRDIRSTTDLTRLSLAPPQPPSPPALILSPLAEPSTLQRQR